MTTWIPRILHLYWGRNKKLSFLRYLTAYSFSKMNPEWEIKVWYPGFPCKKETWSTQEQAHYDWQGKDYFYELEDIPRVTTKEFFFKDIGVREDLAEVVKSDILRLYLLSTEGGVWSDFDILFQEPVENVIVDRKGAQAYFCQQNNRKKTYSIGFLMGRKGNTIYNLLFKCAKLRSEVDQEGYQVVGNKLFKYVLAAGKYNADHLIGYIDPQSVYPFSYQKVEELFGKFRGPAKVFGIGYHWFAGHKRASMVDNRMTEENVDRFKYCRIGILADEIFNRDAVLKSV